MESFSFLPSGKCPTIKSSLFTHTAMFVHRIARFHFCNYMLSYDSCPAMFVYMIAPYKRLDMSVWGNNSRKYVSFLYVFF